MLSRFSFRLHSRITTRLWREIGGFNNSTSGKHSTRLISESDHKERLLLPSTLNCQTLLLGNLTNPRLYSVLTNATQTQEEGSLSISSANTADEILTAVQSLLENGKFGKEATVESLVQLHNIAYKSLDEKTWFQGHNHNVGYIQLLLNQNIIECMLPYTTHEVYPIIYKHIGMFYEKLTVSELAAVLGSLIRMGTSPTDEIITRLMSQCYEINEESDFEELVSLKEVINMVCKSDINFLKKSMNLYKDLLQTTPVSSEHVMLHCRMLTTCIAVMSPEYISLTLDKIIENLKSSPELHSDPEMIGILFRISRRIPIRCQNRRYYQHILQDIGENSIKNHLDIANLEDHQIAEICSSLHFSGKYRNEIPKYFYSRARDLLSQNNVQLNSVSNLMYAFNRDTPHETKRLAENIMFKLLPQADILIISNLAESLRFMNCDNRDLLKLFQKVLVDKLDGILSFVTRFEKIIRHLSWKNFYDQQMESEFVTRLLQHLKSSLVGPATWYTSLAARYLLQHSQHFDTNEYYKDLLAVIPQCSIDELQPILVGLGGMARSHMYINRSQHFNVQNAVYNALLEKLHTISSVTFLSRIVMDMLVNNRTPDPHVIERLMDMFPKLMTELSESEIVRVLEVHSRLVYYQPTVFEKAAKLVIDRKDSVNLYTLSILLSTISRVGYVSKMPDDLVDASLDVITRLGHRVTVKDKLHLLLCLAQLQLFPENAIKEAFSLDFIEQLDQYLEAYPYKRISTEKTMMKLNRCVVLECPQMDIPWFHEQYCKDNIVTARPRDQVFVSQVEQVLSDLVGGDKYYNSWVYSPYFYHINFEVILDENNRPVHVDKAARHPGLRRIAVKTLYESHYCYHSQILNGYEIMRRRHMEILGYRNVEIPYFDWNSMALSDWEAKVDYMKDRLKISLS